MIEYVECMMVRLRCVVGAEERGGGAEERGGGAGSNRSPALTRWLRSRCTLA